MKTQTLILAGVAAFAATLLVAGKAGKAAAASTPAPSDGGQHWYDTSSRQVQITAAAVQQNWRDTFGLLDKTQPDWWV